MALNIFSYKNSKSGLREAKNSLATFEKALPQFKAKEQLLTGVIKTIGTDIKRIEAKIAATYDEVYEWCGVFSDSEFDISPLVRIKKVHTKPEKIAGIAILKYDKVEFYDITIDYSNTPYWTDNAITLLKELAELDAIIQVKKAKFEPLNKALKKARSKAQLFEKMLIPQVSTTIRKIKQSLQDAETLSICSAKIVKAKKEEIA